jgi:polysaccharide export outer membrane protein
MKKVLNLLLLLLALFASTRPVLAAEPPFTIIAGDVLQITVWKEDGMDREVLVLPNGDITFPLVGTLKVQGLTPADVQDGIKGKLKKFIPDAAVTVSVKAALGHTVSVIGQVTKPGEIIISHRLTAMQALSQAGGLTPYASEGNVIVIRHNGDKDISIPVPYDDIAEGDDLDKDIALEPGDVVVVPTARLF